MKGTHKGFDPDLGAKFLQDHGGSVIVRASKSRKPSPKPDLDPPPGMDAQQQHDWLMEQRDLAKANDPNRPETEEDGIHAEALRRLKVRRAYQGPQGQTDD